MEVSYRELSYDDVREAARRLDGVAHRTPVMQSRSLDDRVGAHVYLKCENLQRIGAFKFRGAYNRLVQLSADQRVAGVVAHSSGNHAQAVAYAARLLEMPATIVMPHDAPKSKLQATQDFGAEIVIYDRSLGSQYRAELAAKIADEKGATLVPPFDDDDIIAGAGTAALELLDEVRDLDVVISPVGGGGLFSGTCLATHGVNPNVELYGVEPEAGNDVQQSLARGEIVSIPLPPTIADGLQTQTPAERTVSIIRQHAKAIVTVSDDELRDAMKFAFERLKLVIEPSGAAGLAAVMSGKVPVSKKRVGIIISGGNVDPTRFAALIS